MGTIYHQLAIKAPRAKLYAAIATPQGVGTWWDQQTAVQTSDGLVLEHNPGPSHGVVRLKLAKLIPDTRIEWVCISTHPEDSPASAWTGTHFIFDLSEGESAASTAERASLPDPDARLTTLDFRQTGYDLDSRYAGFNNHAWGQVLSNLKRVCES